MSKTWYQISVKCPHCKEISLMRVYKNAPPLCPRCNKQMNKEEKMMELEDKIQQMKEKEMQKALDRVKCIEDADWEGVTKEIIMKIKEIPTATLIAIQLDHIYGLQVRVICKAGTFVETLRKVCDVEIEVFDSHADIWGNFRTHDERSMEHQHLESYYIINIK